jgi:glycosyltransferase involved in cell wall biosynthesis
MKTLISVVIGSLNRRAYIELTLKTLRDELRNIPGSHEIFVVDGGSTDGSIEWLLTQKDVITIVQHNRGEWEGQKIPKRSWGYFMNLGFKAATGKYTVMLSDDCLVVPGAIRNAFEQFETELAQHKKVGALAFWWRNWPDMKNYWIGKTLGGKMMVNHGMYLSQALKEVDYIDAENFQFYCGDGDLCLKFWEAGYVVEPAHNSYIEHFLEASPKERKVNTMSSNQDFQNYYAKWGNRFKNNESGANTSIYKEHIDDNETYKMFSNVSIVATSRSKIKAQLRQLKRKYFA